MGIETEPRLMFAVRGTRWALGPHAPAVPGSPCHWAAGLSLVGKPNITPRAVSTGRVHRWSHASSQLLASLLRPTVSFLPDINQPTVCGPSFWVLDVWGTVGSSRGASVLSDIGRKSVIPPPECASAPNTPSRGPGGEVWKHLGTAPHPASRQRVLGCCFQPGQPGFPPPAVCSCASHSASLCLSLPLGKARVITGPPPAVPLRSQ